ncbi:MAG: response regulator [Deltaproteobacteria bacterium]|nr:response regulator [Deltaproteobacteria bacterium]
MERILVADGDPHILLLCRDELREEGYEVLVASNAQEALSLLDTACPDLVVLEIMLPDMSGIETLKIIKGTCRQTPVIFHSTYGPPETVPVSQADGVILKSHNLDRLKNAVRRFLPLYRGAQNSRHHQPRSHKHSPRSGACHGYNGN